MTNDLKISRKQLERWLVELKSSTAYATRKELQMILAAPVVEPQCSEVIPQCSELLRTQAAPAVERQEPVASDIAHDRAYRNGLMAGFQFGINGNEKGYAVSLERYNTEIHAAKAESPPAPVAVVTPQQLIDAIQTEQSRLTAEDYLMDSDDCIAVIREVACLDKVKEMNR